MIEHELFLAYGKQAAFLSWHLKDAITNNAQLLVRPFLAVINHHKLQQENDSLLRFEETNCEDGTRLELLFCPGDADITEPSLFF